MILETLAIAVVGAVVTVLLQVWNQFGRKVKGRRLPPGPIRWPIIGCIPQMLMLDKDYPFRQLTALYHKYGEIVSIGLGVHYTVVLGSYEVMKDLLKRPELTLNRYRFQFNDHRTFEEEMGIIWSGGETWTKVRKFTVKQLREKGFRKSGKLEPVIKEEVDWILNRIRSRAEASGGIWEVDISTLSVLPINVLWNCVGGDRFAPDGSSFKENYNLIQATSKLMNATNLLTAFPFLQIFPELSGYNHNTKVHKNCQDYMRNLINDAKKKRSSKDKKPDNFMEAFLDEIEENGGDANASNVMTEKQLIATLMDLFLAGTETVAAMLNWLVLYLTLHPEVQDRARSEIIKNLNYGTEKISYTESDKVPFVVACIWETFRQSPFASVPPPREATADIFYGDYVIPKGTCVMYNFYEVFHDEQFWGDPYSFRPERLLDPTGTALDPDKIERIKQFGFGKRSCFGEAVALETIFGFLVALLSTFYIEVIPGREPSTDPGMPTIILCLAPFAAKFIPLH